MSFRIRALGLLMLIAMTATVATAWLTLRQANRQVRETVTAGQADTSRIAGELRAYGLAHATWDGLAPTVAALAKETGQRIRVVTEAEALLADSDTLAGGGGGGGGGGGRGGGRPPPPAPPPPGEPGSQGVPHTG
ncbi:hypothetical protein ACWCWF_04030, partial [Streptomyces sp. NPDC001665]